MSPSLINDSIILFEAQRIPLRSFSVNWDFVAGFIPTRAMIVLNFTIGTGTLVQTVNGSAINFQTRV